MAYIHEKQGLGLLDEDEARAELNPPDYEDISVPKKIKPVTRFKDNLFAQSKLMSFKEPPLVILWTNIVFEIYHGFGDASGKGFGSTTLSSKGIKHRVGLWGSDDEGESSNWKEFENQVEALEHQAEEGNLTNAMFLFYFTDKSTVESCLHKGNSSSVKLFKLMVRMRKLEMMHNAKIVVSHCLGKWMIREGAGGASRRHLREGVTAGECMLSFIPLNEDPLTRAPNLRLGSSLVQATRPNFSLQQVGLSGVMTTWEEPGTLVEGFLDPTNCERTFIWTLLPGAAEAALEELWKDQLKRHWSTHIIVCPRLLAPEWMKQFYIASDLVLSISAGTADYWPIEMCEPLILGLIFPFINRHPWQLKTHTEDVRNG
jgi:hypothetical protein